MLCRKGPSSAQDIPNVGPCHPKEIRHASRQFHPVLGDCPGLECAVRLRRKPRIRASKHQLHLPRLRGLPGLPLRPRAVDHVFKQPVASSLAEGLRFTSSGGRTGPHDGAKWMPRSKGKPAADDRVCCETTFPPGIHSSIKTGPWNITRIAALDAHGFEWFRTSANFFGDRSRVLPRLLPPLAGLLVSCRGGTTWRGRNIDRDFSAMAVYGANRDLSMSCNQFTIRLSQGRGLALQSSAFLLH